MDRAHCATGCTGAGAAERIAERVNHDISGSLTIQIRYKARRAFSVAALLFLALAAALPGLRPAPALAQSGEISKADYFRPGLAPVRQSGAYDVTMVYFMDYQCPACRKYTPDVARALKEDPRVRVIYRDTPIFGPRSEEAARVAIASAFQGKHEAMHMALMQAPMPLDEETLKAAASKAGVDWGRLQRDLKARGDAIDGQVALNTELATRAGVVGTPAFIIGDTLANGVLDYQGVKGSIADARKANPAAAAAPAEKLPAVEEPAVEKPEDAALPENTAVSERAPEATQQLPSPSDARVAFKPTSRGSVSDDNSSIPAPEARSQALLAAAAGLLVLLLAAIVFRKRLAGLFRSTRDDG